jgi:hypothetical protein
LWSFASQRNPIRANGHSRAAARWRVSSSVGGVNLGHEPSVRPRSSIGALDIPITVVFPSHVVALSHGGACAERIRNGRARSTARVIQRVRHHSVERVGVSSRWARLERRAGVTRIGRGFGGVAMRRLGGQSKRRGPLTRSCWARTQSNIRAILSARRTAGVFPVSPFGLGHGWRRTTRRSVDHSSVTALAAVS